MVPGSGRSGMVTRARNLLELAVLMAAAIASLATSVEEYGPGCRLGIDVTVPPAGSVVLRAQLDWEDSLRYCVLAEGLAVYEGAQRPTAAGLSRLERDAGEAEIEGVGRLLQPELRYPTTDAGHEDPAEYLVDVPDRGDRLVDDDPLRPARWESYLTLHNPTDQEIVADVSGSYLEIVVTR